MKKHIKENCWCQTSSVSPEAPDPVRILTDPDPFSESSTSMVRLTPKVDKQKRWVSKLSKIFASLRLRYRAPDPVF